MPLPEPYINNVNLKTYTELLVAKLAQVVFTNTTNVTDYENEYNGNPLVNVTTLTNPIEINTQYTLPFSYTVGTNQLHITVSGYTMYSGIDYTEIGNNGSTSNKIKFKSYIAEGSILGIIIYPNQVSFGRNIIVNNGVSSDDLKIVSTSSNNAISNNLGAYLNTNKVLPNISSLDTQKEYILEYKNGRIQWVEKN